MFSIVCFVAYETCLIDCWRLFGRFDSFIVMFGAVLLGRVV